MENIVVEVHTDPLAFPLPCRLDHNSLLLRESSDDLYHVFIVIFPDS